MSFCFALLFGLFLILSWLETGHFTAKLLEHSRDGAVRIVYGLCFQIFVGGWLNLFGLISRPVLLFLLLTPFVARVARERWGYFSGLGLSSWLRQVTWLEV